MDPVNNPTEKSCGIADFMRSIFGVTITPDAPNGKGRLAIDNVGVQYGLLALQGGAITPEQFVDLNQKVGGIDIDGNFVAQCTAADRGAGHRLRDRPSQQRGRRGTSPSSTTASARRATTPASTPPFHSFTYRARLDRANGHHDNQVIWLSRTGGVVPTSST